MEELDKAREACAARGRRFSATSHTGRPLVRDAYPPKPTPHMRRSTVYFESATGGPVGVGVKDVLDFDEGEMKGARECPLRNHYIVLCLEVGVVFCRFASRGPVC